MKLKSWYIEWDGTILSYYFLTEFQAKEIAKGYILTIETGDSTIAPTLYFNEKLNSDPALWTKGEIVENYEIVKVVFGESNRR